MEFLKKNTKGILLCLCIAIPCWILGQHFPIIGGPVFGILAGMILTLFIKDKSASRAGLLLYQRKYYSMLSSFLGSD